MQGDVPPALESLNMPKRHTQGQGEVLLSPPDLGAELGDPAGHVGNESVRVDEAHAATVGNCAPREYDVLRSYLFCRSG